MYFLLQNWKRLLPGHRCWEGSWRWWKSQTSCALQSGSRSSWASTTPDPGHGWCRCYSTDNVSSKLAGRDQEDTIELRSHRVCKGVCKHWFFFIYLLTGLHSGKHSSGSIVSSANSDKLSNSSPGFLRSTVLPSDRLIFSCKGSWQSVKFILQCAYVLLFHYWPPGNSRAQS